ncbi:thiol reductase thioredoxin [Paenibacillus baekrokdamisoli]|uniref:Thiol reductase thioredoxin n=1 Tax=Paenibacillus baekrokdamisoli TaxID=1712516 RepID=A0A3G9J006_9BACL|nr:thioredoxin family protein [Paenibacillus baekrokdamisoli]MBB3071259.1 thioredoxin-like negative regulator of GroEL [Paenibacillus baekrokdamisoli]BBH21675.1 thiol reductase thioredoxin [Paenibacillus baekrokdamisoli]
MRIIQTDEAFRETIASHQMTVAVFKTTWCKDCHYIEPFMPDLEAAYSGRIQFIQVDRDDLPDLCSELNILGIPSFIAFRDGRELVRFVNKLRKSREEIEQFLDRALEVSEAL